MPISAFCRQAAPDWLYQHADLLIYLAPSAALAMVIRVLAGAHPFFFLFTVAGTICHELSHFLVGMLTNARPQGLDIVPRRTASGWLLGSVTLARLRWYNAAPTALAPMLIILIPLVVGWWRTRHGLAFKPFDLLIAFALAPQFLSFWPSSVDWRIALRSWPYLCILAAASLAAWHFQLWPEFSQRI